MLQSETNAATPVTLLKEKLSILNLPNIKTVYFENTIKAKLTHM
jgi:hypothetical protein